MFVTPSFKKSLIVEQFQANYLKLTLAVVACLIEMTIKMGSTNARNLFTVTFLHVGIKVCIIAQGICRHLEKYGTQLSCEM